MISWIQKYFQRHFRTVFGVMLALMIISLIGIYNPSSGLGRGDRRTIERHFFEYNLNLPEDMSRLVGDGSFSAALKFGSLQGASEEDIQNYSFQRGATLHLADEWHIPQATAAEVTDMIKTLRRFQGQDGAFDPKAYDSFRLALKTNPNGPTEADVLRVLGDDVRTEKVTKLLSGPGYVLPAEVKQILTQTETTWTLATATVDYTSFNPALKPTDADLTKYFQTESARYQIQPRLVASAVDFPTNAYINQVAVTEADVRAFYDRNPSRFPKPAEAKPADPKAPVTPPKSDPAADFAAVRSTVEAQLKFERAGQLALKAAADFALAVYNGKVTNAAALQKLATERKLPLHTLAPFTRDAGPAEYGGSPDIAGEAWKLSATRFASDPVTTPSGAAVLFWGEIQPARTPGLAEVREKVSADWVENEKRKAYIELGRTIKTQLEAKLKSGETIDKAAAAVATASKVKIDVKTPAAFTPRNPPQDLDRAAFASLNRLEKGQLSDMDTSSGLFVYAIDKKIADLSEANPQYVTTRAQIAASYANFGSGSYVSDLVSAELKKSEPKP